MNNVILDWIFNHRDVVVSLECKDFFDCDTCLRIRMTNFNSRKIMQHFISKETFEIHTLTQNNIIIQLLNNMYAIVTKEE